jgi:DNA (cytosine-5)-methyltransferase 1
MMDIQDPGHRGAPLAPPLRVVDLFCGAGGFSEGFRQAGLAVAVGVDNWHPAVVTHRHNHPEALTLECDVRELDANVLGSVDVLIGSPPCTQFSMSNKAGGGDVDAGMSLVYRFLYFVAVLQPRWWIMENVPRILRYLPPEGQGIPYSRLGLRRRGSLSIPKIMLLDSADFGTPQRRVRAFVGRFPAPRAASVSRTLGEVIRGLPDPAGEVPASFVVDPIYGRKIDVKDLSDHFGRWQLLTPSEVRENRVRKVDHRIYGRMAFPEDLDRPARTQMATLQRVAREATVVRAGARGYRLVTVRESASLQGFPITYQWLGRTLIERYRLTGNAVAPPVAYALASSIRHEAGLGIARRPRVVVAPVVHHRDEPRQDFSKRKGSLARKFQWHVPGVRERGYRVELDNQGEHPAPHPSVRGPRGGRVPHLLEWRAVLHHGTGRGFSMMPYSAEAALKEFEKSSASGSATQRFVRATRTWARELPDATTLQGAYANRSRGKDPRTVLNEIAALVDRYFPRDRRSGKPGDSGERLPIRVAAALVACAIAVEWINHGTGTGDPARCWVPNDWKVRPADARQAS